MPLEKVKETIFAYDKEVIDCEVLRAKNVDLTHSKIYFQGVLLTGSNELPNNPFYFGELDRDNTIKQDTPSYYFSPSNKFKCKS
ncbi:hypothetical protein PW919_001845 [Campylobacter coli]|nr:hypothetical protein [Campylobacter coli]EKT7743204.1 hypothetical protein [Campylobacter coli]EKT7748975.1 hypothetical protein [Campylobacter coli]EKT7763733.1 hypothetical protein [Campylobacter coli]EKT7765625.1 hypothetical protein [Campylobacter coli]